MAGIDLSTAEAKLALWLDAEAKVAAGQAYSMNGRSLTRANLKEIGERIEYWNGWVQRLTANSGRVGMRVRGATPSG